MRIAIPFVLLILATGCRTKLDSESVVQVDPLNAQLRMIDPIASAQKVNVSAKANSGQFNIYIFLEKDKTAVEKEIERNKVPASLLGHKLKTTEADLQAQIPAKETAVVMLTSGDGKAASVRLKIGN